MAKIPVEELVARSRAAQKQIEFATQEQVDAAAKAICRVVYENRELLGKMAAEETRMGTVADKVAKCRNKSTHIWYSIKDRKSVGVIKRDEKMRMMEIAKPMGVVASIVPSTNPVVTPMSNAAFAVKCRNSVIFSPHPRAVQCTKWLVDKFREEMKKVGFPEDLILGVEDGTIEDSSKLMSACDVIVATGGMGMVKAAYSSGKPALGVGQGNVQCIVDRGVDLDDAAGKIVIGRSFDNGLICLGEQTAFIPEDQFDAFIEAIQKKGGYYVDDPATLDKVREGIFPGGGDISRHVVGLTAPQVAEKIGLEGVPADTRVIVVRASGAGHCDVLCREKLCPVIAVIPYGTFEEGVAMMVANLECEGKGHSICIHSNDPAHVEYAAEQCAVSRVIVNQPSGTTGGGSPTNGFRPTTTLGCGSWGNNSFSGNLDMVNLMNITRVGYPLDKPYIPDADVLWAEE